MERGFAMNFEKDIPDYAMVPAKEIDEHVIKPITKEAIYSPVQRTNILRGPEVTIVIEEDVLVPDIKPDLKEILIMEGCCNLSTHEADTTNKKDEYINISGQLILQTLYVPEKSDGLCPIISIETKIPFKEQWQATTPSLTVFDCKVKAIEYTVINERKYRIKALIAICTKEFAESTVSLFEGLTNDHLHVLKEKMAFSHLASRKKDVLSIKEYISSISDTQPGTILMKTINVIENYKQVAADKIVVNGFICVNALCLDKSPIGDACLSDNLHQVQEKVEFTQFIPLNHISGISDSTISFDCSQLKLSVVQHEDGHNVLCLEGDLVTYVELYKALEKDVIVDAYHTEKNFLCNFIESSCITKTGNNGGEASVREIFVPKGLPYDVESILYTTGSVSDFRSSVEMGKIVCEGKIIAKMICSLADDSGTVTSIVEEIPFRHASSIAGLDGNEDIQQDIVIKDFWSEKINGKQLEFNATIFSRTEAFKTSSFKILTDPAFDTSNVASHSSPMVIYCCNEKDTLWQIAKKFKTNMDAIININHLDGEALCQGRKLLIIK